MNRAPLTSAKWTRIINTCLTISRVQEVCMFARRPRSYFYRESERKAAPLREKEGGGEKKGRTRSRIHLVTTACTCNGLLRKADQNETRLDGVCVTRQLSGYFPRNKACVIDKRKKRDGRHVWMSEYFFYILRIISSKFSFEVWYFSFSRSPMWGERFESAVIFDQNALFSP